MTSNQIKTVKMKFVWAMTPCGDICELWKAEHLSSVFAICVKNLTINLPNKTWHPLKTQDCEGHPTSGSHGCLVTIMKEFWRKKENIIDDDENSDDDDDDDDKGAAGMARL